jgi:hypothetical protein
MITITLPDEVEQRPKNEASKRGMQADAYASTLITDSLPKPNIDEATLQWLKEWEAENATDDPAELARREKELKEFREGMNRNRLEMEGPNARLVYA